MLCKGFGSHWRSWFSKNSWEETLMPVLIANTDNWTWSKFWNCYMSHKFWLHLVYDCMKHLCWDTENTSESFCLVVLTSPSIHISPHHCHGRLILVVVLSCSCNPKTKSCLPAAMSATVSVLRGLKLWHFMSLRPVGWMGLFYSEFKSRSWSFFVVQVLTNSSFSCTKEGLTEVSALAENNLPKFTSHQEWLFTYTA